MTAGTWPTRRERPQGGLVAQGITGTVSAGREVPPALGFRKGCTRDFPGVLCPSDKAQDTAPAWRSPSPASLHAFHVCFLVATGISLPVSRFMRVIDEARRSSAPSGKAHCGARSRARDAPST